MIRVLLFFSACYIPAVAYSSIYFPGEKLKDSLLVVVQTAEKEELVDAYNQLALYYNLVDPSKAGGYVRKALDLSRNLKYDHGIAFALKEKGMNVFYSGDILQALTLVEESKVMAERIGDYKLAGQSAHCMGLIYAEIEFFEIAIRYFNEAVSLYQQGNAPHVIAYAYYDIADVYQKSHQLENALDYVNKCFAYSKQINVSTDIGPVHLLIGKIHQKLGNDSLALANFLQAVEVIERQKLNEQLRGIGMMELGHFYLTQNKPDEANYYLQEARIAVEKGPNLVLKGKVLSDLAEAFYLQGSFENAYSTLDSAIAIGKQVASVNILSKALFFKARVSKALGNNEAAYLHLLSAYALKDSLSSAGFRSLIAGQVATFETQKAENKIVNLNTELKTKKDELDDKRAQLNLYLIIGVFIIGLLIVIVWNLFRMKRLTKALFSANEHVRQQNVELVHLNEEKNNLMKLVAHDMRSPVNNIVSISGLMKRRDVTEEERTEYLELIDSICHKLDLTISKFLDSKDASEKRLVLYPEVFELTQMLRQLIKEFDPKAATKNISVNFSAPHFEVQAFTDKSYVVQISSNLLSNAIKFSPRDSAVTVTLDCTDNDFIVTVEDQGPGISPEEQKELFKMYSTTSNKPTDNEASTGLGLAIAKQMAEALGGSIHLESALGKGSVFTARIPLEFSETKKRFVF